MNANYFVFISTQEGDPWGGSEELWARTARRLAEQGHRVVASVHGWPQLDSRILDLSKYRVDVRPRYNDRSLVARLRRRVSGKTQFILNIESSVGPITPDLVFISNGGPYPPIELVELCISKGWPFATIAHANWDQGWPIDEVAARYRMALPQAKRCFFVSQANRVLEEMQLGCSLDNAEIVRNPVNLKIEAPLPWPSPGPEQCLLMACVGRLYPPQKGQDLLVQVLTNPRWRVRNWRVALYGDGQHRQGLESLIRRSDLTDRIVLKGHFAIDQIWRENHILIMPSRYEGLPLAIVEAMLCGRPVLATNVAGNAEVIDDSATGYIAESASRESLDKALERMWENRGNLQDMGKLASTRIRQLIPSDPIEVFAGKLLNLASLQSASGLTKKADAAHVNSDIL